ncbi:MAG: tRNA (guanosine(46)-N7)-methyltransferase TrmB [SAR86 cluster bacterium]|uniref:tRNA (guanine-N(7)-)-methyltransferase n=1 Tax=SAR86 cluster bacterium TaxID=2030880 RepID=A0A2A4MQ54_9GAMM|nr:MAG: tRNA (guanosine(46)-N7)-methyltransferase TrmB [SAR86 cluster bacterium]
MCSSNDKPKPTTEATLAESNNSLDSSDTSKHRPIRSYVIRSGRLTDSQSKALELYAKHYVVEFNHQAFDLSRLFPRQADIIVEIGFGMGDSLLEMAKQNPQQNYLGIEVHKPGIGKLLQGIASEQLSNLKIVCHDAKEVLAEGFTDDSLSRIHIYFPDPWHKKKHNKRRLIQTQFVQLLMKKLSKGGHIHLATDWQPYAEHMLEVLSNIDDLKNCLGDDVYWQDHDRPTTKFEKRGRKLGHGVWDLLFTTTV